MLDPGETGRFSETGPVTQSVLSRNAGPRPRAVRSHPPAIMLDECPSSIPRSRSPHRGTSLHEVTRMDLSSASIALRLLAVFALVAANGLFVAAEFSIVKARRTRIAQLVRAGRRGARLVQRATENPEPFVAATQIGITMARPGLGGVGGPLVRPPIEPPRGGPPIT